MSADLVLHDGLLVTEDQIIEGSVVVKDGKIAAIVAGICRERARDDFDLAGRLLFPGVVDAHVHFNHLGHDLEGYRSGTSAAAAGGVTTVVEMPLNDVPPVTSLDILYRKREIAAREAHVDYAQFGGFVDDNLAALEGMHAAGVVGFKAFMRPVPDFNAVNDGLLYAGLRKARELGALIAVHAENASIHQRLRDEASAADRQDAKAFEEANPLVIEQEAIRRAVYLAQETGARLHIVHASTASGVLVASAARSGGADVTVETCPHYLTLDSDMFRELGVAAKVAPPLRPPAEVEALWRALSRGHIDLIASDHAPLSTERDVNLAEGNLFSGLAGIRGIQVMLPILADEAIRKRGALTWASLATLLSGEPARRFGLFPRKGTIAVGADADFAVLSNTRWTLRRENFLSRHLVSPYFGRSFDTRVDATIVRGTIVYEDGRIVGEPGFGQLVRRAATRSAASMPAYARKRNHEVR